MQESNIEDIIYKDTCWLSFIPRHYKYHYLATNIIYDKYNRIKDIIENNVYLSSSHFRQKLVFYFLKHRDAKNIDKTIKMNGSNAKIVMNRFVVIEDDLFEREKEKIRIAYKKHGVECGYPIYDEIM